MHVALGVVVPWLSCAQFTTAAQRYLSMIWPSSVQGACCSFSPVGLDSGTAYVAALEMACLAAVVADDNGAGIRWCC